ncbi:hypothetical protein CCR97_10250 [Rhodoplanes elegans]|uniref:Uncharacterized protein n=1 Tax=Rhodoplanes elegans TaxID=29408 RepID=A0A327KQ37_9BRAD|nr:hypothetical protein [Rhodoplanes elegans]MBK5958587.1 hypothetical protein [Rhodoplanes elegans]RAI40521.1 hypothetical protein CH338_05910 [Rhodoplanes elegans]
MRTRSHAQRRATASSAVDGVPWPARVVDTITLMARAKQIGSAEHAAALRYRSAFERTYGGSSHLLDPDRTPSAPSSGSHSAARLAAGLLLNEADRALARVGGTVVVEMVVGRGYTIDDAAGSLFGRDEQGRTRKADRDHVGAWLKLSLRRLAKLWGSGRDQVATG